MKKSEINWFSISRKDIPETLLGVSRPDVRLVFFPDSAPRAELLVGYSQASSDFPNSVKREVLGNSPNFVLVDKSSLAETFSWISTYIPEFFPLSQYARTLTIDEFRTILPTTENRSAQNPTATAWGSIVLGEAIGQSGIDEDISQIPLSRVNSCYSTAIARVSLIYGSDSKIIDTCIDRLQLLQSDQAFVRKNISVDNLIHIWALADAADDHNKSVPKIIGAVLGALDAQKHSLTKINLKDFLSSFDELSSDSAEMRVVGFERLTNELKISPALDKQFSAIAFAAAAFLVGRGTSHIDLLSPYKNLQTSPYPWFGLFAGICGPQSWHDKWARCVKGVEKSLKASIDISELSTSDLSWAEYHWMTSVFPSPDRLSDIPKQFSRQISIEIIPGASCQLKLSQTEPAHSNSQKAETARADIGMALRHDLQYALNAALASAQMLQRVIKSTELPPTQKTQASLFNEPTALPVKPKSAPKRAKKQ